MADRYSNLSDVARYAYQDPDGTIFYIESDGTRAKRGMLPPNQGNDPAALKAQGFTFLDRNAYMRTQQSLDPSARAEAFDADTLAQAWDASMGKSDSAPVPQEQDMNGQLDPETMEILEKYMAEGRLDDLFQPFEQEQGVLDQQMAMGRQMQQPTSQRGTPIGSALSSVANAMGRVGGAHQQAKALEGQTALGKRMQGDASGRTAALMEMIRKRKGIDPKTGLMGTAVGDDELAAIMGGGL